MPTTPDRNAGTREEEELLLDDRTADGDPADERAMRYVGGEFRLKDSIGVFNPRSGGGISQAQHKVLLDLIHFIDEGPADTFTTGATKTTTGTVFPTQNLWRRSDSTKLVEQNITWTGAKPTTVEWKMYTTDGTTVLATVTDTISYSGPFETSRARAIV